MQLATVITRGLRVLAAAGLDEGRLDGFHWAVRYLEGVNAVLVL